MYSCLYFFNVKIVCIIKYYNLIFTFRTSGVDDDKLDSMAGMSASALPRPKTPKSAKSTRRQIRQSAREVDLQSSSSECPSLPRQRPRFRSASRDRTSGAKSLGSAGSGGARSLVSSSGSRSLTPGKIVSSGNIRSNSKKVNNLF